MLNDDYITAVAKHINGIYRDKNRFLSELKLRFNVTLIKNPTYKSAITKVIADGKEKEFSLAFLNSESIEDWIQSTSRQEILDWFTKSEILKIAKVLKESDSTWFPDRGVKKALIFSILKRFDNDEIGEAIAQFQHKEDIDDYSFSTDDYVVGPLGVMEIEKKKDWHSKNLIRQVVSGFLDKSRIHDFMSVISGNSQEFKVSKSDPQIMEKALQFTLVKYSEEEVFDAIGKLIAIGKIIVSSVIKIDEYRFLTPFGIIESRNNPLDNLVDIIIKYTREDTLLTQLKQHEIPIENLSQGVVDLCLRESPRYFGRLFGPDKMKDIAREMNMVALDHVTVDNIRELWDVILMAMGFQIPSEPSTDFLSQVIRTRTEIMNLDVLELVEKESRLVGLMIKFYSRCERLMRDLFYFHAVTIWNEEIGYEYDEPDLEHLNGKIVDDLELDENLEVKLSNKRLTFGEWVGLLRKLGNYIQGRSPESKMARANMIRYTRRKELLGNCPFDILNNSAASRNQYRHDREGSIPSLNDSLEIIDDAEHLYECFIKNGVVPVNMRVLSEIRNEFGLEYFVITDENNHRRLIQKNEDIPTKNSFMMPANGDFSPERYIAVVPFW